MANGLLLYTHQQRAELVDRYPDLGPSCFVAPNSLYLESDMSPFENLPAPSDFIYVGRLVKSKKVELLIRAFSLFSAKTPLSTLHLVGDGEESEALRDLASSLGCNAIFHGHVSDRSRLRELYSRSVSSVSPGYVGLSITQSFSFGVPMIISRDEPHSPEIEAFKDGMNGSFFSTDDAEDLRLKMTHWYDQRAILGSLSPSIVEHCKRTYSVERMVEGFREAMGA